MSEKPATYGKSRKARKRRKATAEGARPERSKLASAVDELYARRLRGQLGEDAPASLEALLLSRGLAADVDELLLLTLGAAASLPVLPVSDPGRSLTVPEADVLVEGGFATKAREGGARYEEADPVARSVAEYAALLASSRSVAEMAKLLGVETSRIRQRLGDRTIYGIKSGRTWRLPAFQVEGRGLVPNIGAVLREVPADLHPVALQSWFAAACVDLLPPVSDAPMSPRQWLCAGHDAGPVIELARQL